MAQERTQLSPAEEQAFRAWAQANHIENYDHPDAHYDMRGFWRQTQGQPHPPGSEQHFPDTFKQHGHPTFSVESQYSAGPFDGGRWINDSFVPPGADLMMNSRGQSRLDPQALRAAVMALVSGMKQ
jgi:hypothetical protein